MERAYNRSNDEHVIDIVGTSDASPSSSTRATLTGRVEEQQTNEFQSSTSSGTLASQPAAVSVGSNTRNSSLLLSGNSQGQQRSPLNSGLWISVDILLNLIQIIASIIILYLSKNEKPRAPLRTWILGYASGCCAILPLLFWRFKHRNVDSGNDLSQSNGNAGPFNGRVRDRQDLAAIGTTATGSQVAGSPHPRLKTFVEYFKIALDCFFAVWFVVGNVWIFGWHSSAAEAPYLYRLCIIFMAFSCIGYAMPLILCITICCWLPCLISIMGLREDFPQNKGATQESINALPIYKFKEKKANRSCDKESGAGECCIVATGTENERAISREDAVCSICLSKYVNNDELRELPCSHLFHKECLDKWLKISASCPLCKAEVGETPLTSLTRATTRLSNRTI